MLANTSESFKPTGKAFQYLKIFQPLGCGVIASKSSPPNGFINHPYLEHIASNASVSPVDEDGSLNGTGVRMIWSDASNSLVRAGRGSHRPRRSKGVNGITTKQSRMTKGTVETFRLLGGKHKHLCIIFPTFTMPSKFSSGKKLTDEHYRKLFAVTADITHHLTVQIQRVIERINSYYGVPQFHIPNRYLVVKEPQFGRFQKYGYLCIHWHVLMFNIYNKYKKEYLIKIDDDNPKLKKDTLMGMWQDILNRFGRELFGEEFLFEAASMHVEKIKNTKGVKDYLNKLAGIRKYLDKLSSNGNTNSNNDKPISRAEMFRMFQRAGYTEFGFAWVTCDRQTHKELQEYVDGHKVYVEVPSIEFLDIILNDCPSIKTHRIFVKDSNGNRLLDYPVALCVNVLGEYGEDAWATIMMWLSEIGLEYSSSLGQNI